MADESRTSDPGASIHDNHYCEHLGCQAWGCYGFEQDKRTVKWFCSEHQPDVYRGLLKHVASA